MQVRWTHACLDRPRETLGAAAGFWAAVTGTAPSDRLGSGSEFIRLRPAEGDAYVLLQGVGAGNGVHLDLEVDDVPAAVATATDLGATYVTTGEWWTVMRSPGGQPFCLLDWRGPRERPPETGDDHVTSLLDQVCLDIPPAVYDDEVAFWVALTGWTHSPGARPEFDTLTQPAGMPVRILLQRLDSEQPASAHLDFACSDVGATRVRHERLGARFVARWPWWAVMADPTGGTYCLTVREPATGTLPRWAVAPEG